jgi:uncharacterized protein (TIGR00299 family) protein
VSGPGHGWVDASAGLAGDMLLGALLDAGAPLEEVQHAVDAVLPGAVRLSTDQVTRAGQRATKLTVEVLTADLPERRWSTIRELIDAAALAEPVRDRAVRTFARLARAEARVHGVEPDAVHFHEVGALDSIADIVGVAAALHALEIETLSCGRIAVGSGQVRTAHGTMPVPVPAVVELATGWRVYAGGAGELATPTGLALVAALAETSEDLPLLDQRGAGCGAGSRDTPDRPNVTRVLIGTRPSAATDSGTALEAAVLLQTNVDDLDPRLWPGILSSLLEAGAADAWLVPIIMKKGRPAHTLSVLAHPGQVAPLRELILSRTSTIGVRESTVSRTVLARGWVDVSVAGVDLPVKIAHRAGVISQATPEFDELERAAARLARAPRDLLAEALSSIHLSGLVAGAAVPEGLRTGREPGDKAGADPGSAR